jgi:hypothetical protein
MKNTAALDPLAISLMYNHEGLEEQQIDDEIILVDTNKLACIRLDATASKVHLAIKRSHHLHDVAIILSNSCSIEYSDALKYSIQIIINICSVGIGLLAFAEGQLVPTSSLLDVKKADHIEKDIDHVY